MNPQILINGKLSGSFVASKGQDFTDKQKTDIMNLLSSKKSNPSTNETEIKILQDIVDNFEEVKEEKVSSSLDTPKTQPKK